MIPDQGRYPGLEERRGRLRNEQVALLVPARHLQKLAENKNRDLTLVDVLVNDQAYAAATSFFRTMSMCRRRL